MKPRVYLPGDGCRICPSCRSILEAEASDKEALRIARRLPYNCWHPKGGTTWKEVLRAEVRERKRRRGRK